MPSVTMWTLTLARLHFMTEANPYATPIEQRPPLSPAEEKQWSIITHLASLFFPLIAAAVMYFLFRDRGPFVRAHVTTAWNFQLTVAIASGLGFVFAFGSFFITLFSLPQSGAGMPPGMGFFFVGYFLIMAVQLLNWVFSIIAAVAASRGVFYRYPIAIPFAKV